MLTARKLIQTKLQDIENSLRGILRGFGLKVGKTTKRSFASRISELVVGHPALETIAAALLAAHMVLVREFNGFEKRVRAMSLLDAKARLLMSTPAVGPIISLTYASAIDDPSRFPSSKRAGPLFGLTPKKYQSGETDYSGRISKNGDASVREALYEAAHIILTKPIKGCAQLKSWAMRIARRAGMNKAKVAQARRDHAAHAQGQRSLQPGCPANTRGSLKQERTGFRAGLHTRLFPKRSPFAGTMDQVRPSCGLSTHPTM
jgi:transposase